MKHITMNIVLDDTSLENGCLHYVPGSHRWPLLAPVSFGQDMDAFRACTTLYRIHHPEASLNEARRLVAEWIDHHVVRADAGPTRGCDCG